MDTYSKIRKPIRQQNLSHEVDFDNPYRKYLKPKGRKSVLKVNKQSETNANKDKMDIYGK